MANLVLLEDWSSAVDLMRRIGKNGSVSHTNYRDWPLFRDIRKQSTFLTAYQEIFGEEFFEQKDVKSATGVQGKSKSKKKRTTIQ